MKPLAIFVLLQTAFSLTVWPKPQVIKDPPVPQLLVLDSAVFRFDSTGASSDILNDGFQRYYSIIFGGRTTTQKKMEGSAAMDTVKGCNVKVLDSSLELSLSTDESYNITIASPMITITSATVFGALRGLETLSQLVDSTHTVNATSIKDFPRFPFRASMIDTSRHFYPVSTIFAHLDAMAYNKFNVLHWHLVDSVSFPYQSSTFPSLSATGAWTPDHVYTRKDIKDIVDYALYRGIRVIPEFDTPGHMTAGFESIPNLLTECYDTRGKSTGVGQVLNPTLDSTYEFMTKFMAEIKEVFPDKFVHVGGDEVNFDCWESNPQIQQWMKEHPEIKDYAALEQYYELKLLTLLEAQNTSYICWQEIFDNGVKILPDTVVDVWKGGGWQQDIARVTAAGYTAVLSAPFYLNYISYGKDWPKYYTTEPTNFNGTKQQKNKVGGIEMCMWSEYVDSTNFIPRYWPRGAAVGERGWSAENVNDVNEATPRMEEWRCKMLRRGLNVEPPSGPGFCDEEYVPAYSPPWVN